MKINDKKIIYLKNLKILFNLIIILLLGFFLNTLLKYFITFLPIKQLKNDIKNKNCKMLKDIFK